MHRDQDHGLAPEGPQDLPPAPRGQFDQLLLAVVALEREPGSALLALATFLQFLVVTARPHLVANPGARQSYSTRSRAGRQS